MSEKEKKEKSCHRCIHCSVCELYRLLERTDKHLGYRFFNSITKIAEICIRYKSG